MKKKIVISTGKRLKKLIFLSLPFLMLLNVSAHGRCVQVNGVLVERIGDKRVLLKREDKSIAILEVMRFNIPYNLSSNIRSYRFFSNKVCDTGAEAIIHIDGNDWMVFKVLQFSD